MGAQKYYYCMVVQGGTLLDCECTKGSHYYCIGGTICLDPLHILNEFTQTITTLKKAINV